MNLNRAIEIFEKGLTFDIVKQSGLFPPLDILNLFFQCGFDDIESGRLLRWEPFILNRLEYIKFHEACENQAGKLQIDALGFHRYADWFSAAAIRNRND